MLMMKQTTSIVLRIAPLFLLVAGGCDIIKYAATPQGKFGGKIVLEWIGPDEFIYRQDPTDPLYFERANGTRIVPEDMYTDGGSIPRPMWVFRNYSPWGYGPAFIIHDWLFNAHHCDTPGYNNYTVTEAADVMAECEKTLMETGKAHRSTLTLYVMHQAVSSPAAVWLWNNGKCVPIKDAEAKIAIKKIIPPKIAWDLNESPPSEPEMNPR